MATTAAATRAMPAITTSATLLLPGARGTAAAAPASISGGGTGVTSGKASASTSGMASGTASSIASGATSSPDPSSSRESSPKATSPSHAEGSGADTDDGPGFTEMAWPHRLQRMRKARPAIRSSAT
jgi:hypothetical protein